MLPAEAQALTQTQQVLHGIRKTEPLNIDALIPLMQLEARELPYAFDWTIRTFCSDLTSIPAAWTAHNVCQRCQEINRIMQGEWLALECCG